MKPQISVLTATYNRPDLLKEAVASILAQTFTNFELIVINDGGMDVAPVLEAFHDPRLIYLNLPENHGKAYALNRGIETSRGRYLAYLDDDDHFFPQHLQTLLTEIETHPEVDLVYSDFEEVEYELTGEGRRVVTGRRVDFSRDFDRIALLRQNYIPHPTILHRREILEQYGAFDESYSCLIDWELLQRLAFYCDFLHVRQVTGEYFRNEQKGDHITNMLVNRREFYLDHFYGTRRRLPREAWKHVLRITVLVKPHSGENNLGEYLKLLVANTTYPCQILLAVQEESEIRGLDLEWMRKMNLQVCSLKPDEDPLLVAVERGFGDYLITFETNYFPHEGWLGNLAQHWQRVELERPLSLSFQGDQPSPWGWALSRTDASRGLNGLHEILKSEIADGGCLASIIIPVRNKIEFTRQCLASLLDHPPLIPHEIIVVDNASDDGTAELLENLDSKGILKWLRNDPPHPFAASCNRGAREARGRFLVFLNNDTVALPGWLEELVRVAESAPDIAAVGAKLLYPDKSIQHAGVAFHHYRKVGAIGPYHLFKHFPSTHPAVNKLRDFRVVTGACMLTPAILFRRLEGFDERYINCFEDVDYCLKVHACGYRVVYTPKAELIHFEGQTAGRNDNVNRSWAVLQEKWRGKLEVDEDRYLKEDGFVIHENNQGGLVMCIIEELRQWQEAIGQLIDLQAWNPALEEIIRYENLLGTYHTSILELRGRLALGMGNLEQAQTVYTQVDRLSPDNPEIKWQIVQIVMALGKPDEARARLRRLLSDYPDNPRQEQWRQTMEEIGSSPRTRPSETIKQRELTADMA